MDNYYGSVWWVPFLLLTKDVDALFLTHYTSNSSNSITIKSKVLA
jgi:hypothetical protein